MIKLVEQDIKTLDRQSSKGNQLKWKSKSIWYKADYTGYEGLSEYIISSLLNLSSLSKEEFVSYEVEEISYKYRAMLGCRSHNFLPEGWNIITLERLFQNYFGLGLHQALYEIQGSEARVNFLVKETVRITGLSDFHDYFSKLITIDSFFLNEGRHTHNIAVLLDEKGDYHYCPYFDNGAGLLSDIKQDYPLDIDTFKLLKDAKPKTFCEDFDEQLDTVEELYGDTLQFHFTKKDVQRLMDEEAFYPKEVKERVLDIIYHQMDKYQPLFNNK